MTRRHARIDQLTAAVLAVVFVFAGAASIAARSAKTNACQMEGQHCGQLALAECCCDGHPTDAATLPTTVSDRVRVGDACIGLQAVPATLAIVPDPDTAAATVLRPDVPAHGLRFIELPILFSTFLL